MSENPRLSSLPADDHRREVVWTGRINAQSSEFKTARFTSWLRRIDEDGRPIDDRVDQVVESIGAISLFPIGACFLNQQRVNRVDQSPGIVLSLNVPEQWLVRRAIDKQPDSDQFLISPRDLPLKFNGWRGEQIAGYSAYLVVAETTAGKRVLIPCSEVYRAFFSGSSGLANSHFRRSWSDARKDFIEDSRESVDDKGQRIWHVDLAKNVPHSIAKDLCWLEFVPGAARIADQTHKSIVNQLQQRIDPWIRAAPPISSGTLLIHAQVKRLPRSDAVLITQIRAFRSDVPVAKITCTIDEQMAPSGPGSEPSKAPVEKPRHKPSAIARPGDRRNTKRFFDLGSDPMHWRGLPEPEVSPRKIRCNGGGGPTRSDVVDVPVAVSVGEASDKEGTRPAAQLTPTETLLLDQRFEDVIKALDGLQQSGRLNAWSYPSINSSAQDGFFSFPDLRSATDQPKGAGWCRVKDRARYALVLQLEIKDRTVYWIEIEPCPRGYKGLAIEILDGQQIDGATVDSLLRACASSNGVWDDSANKTSRPLLLAAERHDPLKKAGGLSPNMFIRAFNRLAAKRSKREVEEELEATTEETVTEQISINAVVPY